MRKTFYFFVIQVGVWYKQTDFLHWEISLLWKNRWLAWCDQKTKPFGSLHNRIKQLTDGINFVNVNDGRRSLSGLGEKISDPGSSKTTWGKIPFWKLKVGTDEILFYVQCDQIGRVFLLKTKCMVTFEAFWKKICFKARTGVDTLGVFLTYLGCILFSRLVTLCMGYF